MKKYIDTGILLLVFLVSNAQNTFVSELNQKAFSPDSIQYPYKIVFGGHLYGSQNEAAKPYASFSNSLNKINNEKAALFFSLGDAVRKPDLATYDIFSDLTLKVEAPVFTAMGNHEWEDPITSQMYLGFPYYIIEAPGSAFIILNSEDWGNKEQKAFWDKQLNDYINNAAVKNIFILSHRLIWATGNPMFADLVQLTNSPEMHSGEQLIDLNKLKPHLDKQFYFIAGDVGLNGRLPFFFQREGNLTFIATGLGDLPTDAVIEATVYKDKDVEFKPLYLGTNEQAQLADYNMTKVAQLVRKTETINTAAQLNNSTTTKAFVLILTMAAFGVGLYLLLGKNEV